MTVQYLIQGLQANGASEARLTALEARHQVGAAWATHEPTCAGLHSSQWHAMQAMRHGEQLVELGKDDKRLAQSLYKQRYTGV